MKETKDLVNENNKPLSREIKAESIKIPHVHELVGSAL
jgi:hypothetical protein